MLTIDQAIAIATEAHGAQKDKSGRPYIEHLTAVAVGVWVLGGDEEIQAAAILHDIVEDTKTTPIHLIGAGASPRQVIVVQALTKKPMEAQTDYLARIKAAGIDAEMVKAADILHNMRRDRHASLSPYVQERHKKKYQPSLAALLLDLGLISTEDQQKTLATKPANSVSTGLATWKPASTRKSGYRDDDLFADMENIVSPGRSVKTKITRRALSTRVMTGKPSATIPKDPKEYRPRKASLLLKGDKVKSCDGRELEIAYFEKKADSVLFTFINGEWTTVHSTDHLVSAWRSA